LSLREHRDVLRIALLTAVSGCFLAFTASLGEKTDRELAELTSRVGRNIFYARRTDGAGSTFLPEDLGRVRGLPSVGIAAGIGSSSTVNKPGDEYSLTWQQVSTDFDRVLQLEIAEGQALSGQPNTAVLGFDVKLALYGQGPALGRVLDGKVVIGVLERIPSDDAFRAPYNRRILTHDMPLPTLSPAPTSSSFSTLMVQAQRDIDEAIEDLRELFPEIEVVPVSQFYQIASQAEDTALLRLMMLSSWGMTAMAAALICTVLALSVLQRTREIGIRRALGASQRHVLRQFIGFGVAGSIVGGSVGGVVGVGLAWALYDGLFVGLAHALAVPVFAVIGIIASAGPARRAARMSVNLAIEERGLFSGLHRHCLLYTAVGVTTAIAAGCVIVLYGAQLAFSIEIDRMWGDIDDRLLVVQADRNGILAAPSLKVEDETLLQDVQEIEVIVPLWIQTVRSGMTVAAVGEAFSRLHVLAIGSGRELRQQELAAGEPVCVVSERLADELFDGLAVGREVDVKGTWFLIVGQYTQPPARHEFPVDVVLPMSHADLLPIGRAEFLVRSVDPGANAEVTQQVVARFQEEYPRCSPVVVTVVNRLEAQFSRFYGNASVHLGFLVAVACVYSAYGMVVMGRYLLSQRIWRYGIERVLGAPRRAILRDVLSTGAVIAIPGAGVGVLGGAIVLPAVLRSVYLRGSLSLFVAAVSVAVPAILACIAATFVLTMLRAAAQQPAVLLHRGRP